MSNPICGFDGYEITEYGRVLSLKSCKKWDSGRQNNGAKYVVSAYQEVEE